LPVTRSFVYLHSYLIEVDGLAWKAGTVQGASCAGMLHHVPACCTQGVLEGLKMADAPKADLPAGSMTVTLHDYQKRALGCGSLTRFRFYPFGHLRMVQALWTLADGSSLPSVPFLDIYELQYRVCRVIGCWMPVFWL
jgi:hypothetical protein